MTILTFVLVLLTVTQLSKHFIKRNKTDILLYLYYSFLNSCKMSLIKSGTTHITGKLSHTEVTIQLKDYSGKY